jgi:hypothetical protein
LQQLEPQAVPEEQTQLLAVPEQTFPVPHEPSTQCPLELQVWGTPALHCVFVGVQSAQAFWTQVQGCEVWEQVPWLLQVPASWRVAESRQCVLPHGVLTGNTQSGLDPVQVEAQVSVPLQAFPDGGVVTFVQVAVVADEVQVSQDPVQERLP